MSHLRHRSSMSRQPLRLNQHDMIDSGATEVERGFPNIQVSPARCVVESTSFSLLFVKYTLLRARFPKRVPQGTEPAPTSGPLMPRTPPGPTPPTAGAPGPSSSSASIWFPLPPGFLPRLQFPSPVPGSGSTMRSGRKILVHILPHDPPPSSFVSSHSGFHYPQFT